VVTFSQVVWRIGCWLVLASHGYRVTDKAIS
jgi:hypothetical protein